jgi:Vitamin K-dependent gamma-carboxylase
MATTLRAMGTRAVEWWFRPLPRARIALLRTILYSFVFVDVLVTTSWVAKHAALPGELYRPLFLERLLHLPAPGPLSVPIIKVLLLLFAAIALSGRLPRLAGSAVALLYLHWMLIAFSYGKVDHDRFAFLVALAVLPTVGAARARETTEDDASGWAIRAIQVAVVLTYFLSAIAKIRFGGVDWVTGTTLMRAVVRRGTSLGDLLSQAPVLLTTTQWLLLGFEFAAPLLLIGGRVRRWMLTTCVAFHVITFASITIIFLPHVICLLSFVPLESVVAQRGGLSFARPLLGRASKWGDAPAER